MAGDATGFLFILGTVGTLAGVYYIYNHYELYRLVSETPTTDVGSLSGEGLVELTGTVRAVDTLDVTLSGTREAVVSGWQVKDYREGGDSSSWETIAMGVDGAEFEVDDGTGTVRVDPPSETSGHLETDDKLLSMGGDGVFLDDTRAEFRQFGKVHQFAPDESPPTHVENFVRTQSAVGQQEESRLTLFDIGTKDGERRYYEGTVEDGDDIYLLGHARTREDATHPLGPDDLVVSPTSDPFVVSEVSEGRLLSQTRRNLAIAAAVVVVSLGLLGFAWAEYALGFSIAW